MSEFLEQKRTPISIAIGCLLAGTVFSVTAQENEEQQEQQASERPERITVLGSRIRSDGLDQASPVEVISAADALSQGLGSLGELLRTSTVAAGSNQITAATSSSITEGGAGVETVSLRGLGANRTLVLLNGRRIGPAGTRGQVSAFDLNIMPLAAVDRVEILKDGASSLYGSDAVAGVVNIITRTGDESVFNANYSKPEQSGGETLRLSGSIGRSFDRGSVRVVADYRKDRELARGDRDFYACAESYFFNPDSGARADVIDPRTGEFHCSDLPWGHVWLYDYTRFFEDGTSNVPAGGGSRLAQFDYDGNLAQWIPGYQADPNNPAHLRTPEGWFPVNYDRTSAGLTNASHPFQDLTTLSPERETQTVFAHGEYWLSDRTTLYAEALLNRRETIRNGYRQFWNLFHYTEDGDQWLGTGSPLSEGWTGAFILSSTPITDWSGETITVDYTRFVVGAEGYIGDWSWDVNAQTSRSDGDYRTKIIFNDAITPQQGIGAPCAGQPTPVRGVPCVDLPWLDPEFLAGNISQQYRDFLFGEETGNTVYKQHTVEAIFSGELYELPAGMMQAAFGAQYQRDEITDTPGEVTLASNTWGSTSAGITTGSSNTRAVFGELQIPVLYGARFADRLNVELSARHTDVSASGNDTTYKAGFNWDIARGYRIRGSQGTSFRSPALYELYLNDQTSFTRGIDPCVNWESALANGNIPDIVAQNCAADGIPGDYAGAAISTTVRSGGGFGELEAETSLARTLGFVWTPDSVNFGLSIDYFDIEIKGEVTQLSAGQVVMGCYMSENFATEPFCNQFDRDDDFRIDTVRANYQNIASERNRGYDLIASYFHDFDFGRVSVRYNHTYTIEASRQLFETSEREDRAGRLGRPEHVGTLLVGFDRDNWSVNWTTRYVGKASNHEWYGQGTFRDDATLWGEPVRVVLATPSIFYHSVSGTYDFNSGLRLTAGIANLFDQDPPVLSRSNFTSRVGRSAFYSQYDNLGRRGFIDLSYSF